MKLSNSEILEIKALSDGGSSVKDLCEQRGISVQGYYKRIKSLSKSVEKVEGAIQLQAAGVPSLLERV